SAELRRPGSRSNTSDDRSTCGHIPRREWADLLLLSGQAQDLSISATLPPPILTVQTPQIDRGSRSAVAIRRARPAGTIAIEERKDVAEKGQEVAPRRRGCSFCHDDSGSSGYGSGPDSSGRENRHALDRCKRAERQALVRWIACAARTTPASADAQFQPGVDPDPGCSGATRCVARPGGSDASVQA